jgi:hypothetical protein
MADKVLITVKGGEVVVHTDSPVEFTVFNFDDWVEGTLEDRRLGLEPLEKVGHLAPVWLKAAVEAHREAWNAEVMHNGD